MTTRGNGADIVILDEAAHIDPDLFYQTIVPILPIRNTSLLALSSPSGNENYYSKLLNLKDQDGHDFFKIINKQMTCKECMKGSRLQQLSCTHMQTTEFWIEDEKYERTKLLYKDAPGLGLQELAGMITSSYTPCFNEDDIAACFAIPRVVTKSPPGIILMTADPNQGGPSHLAITSVYFDVTWNMVVSCRRYVFFPIVLVVPLCMWVSPHRIQIRFVFRVYCIY